MEIRRRPNKKYSQKLTDFRANSHRLLANGQPEILLRIQRHLILAFAVEQKVRQQNGRVGERLKVDAARRHRGAHESRLALASHVLEGVQVEAQPSGHAAQNVGAHEMVHLANGQLWVDENVRRNLAHAFDEAAPAIDANFRLVNGLFDRKVQASPDVGVHIFAVDRFDFEDLVRRCALLDQRVVAHEHHALREATLQHLYRVLVGNSFCNMKLLLDFYCKPKHSMLVMQCFR